MITFRQIAKVQTDKIRLATKESIMTVLNELEGRPDITIDHAALAEFNKSNAFPYIVAGQVDNALGRLLKYKGVTINLNTTVSCVDFTLSFPPIVKKKFCSWISSYHPVETWVLSMDEKCSVVTVEGCLDTEGLYAALVAKYNHYLSRIKSIEKSNAEQQAFLKKREQEMFDQGLEVKIV